MKKRVTSRLVVAFALLLFSSASKVSAGYNAIFFAPKNNVAGASYGQETKKKALKKARKQCKQRGGRGCREIVWSNRCTALYVSPNTGKYGWGGSWGNSRAEAKRKAYRACKKSNFYCISRISACEDAYED